MTERTMVRVKAIASRAGNGVEWGSCSMWLTPGSVQSAHSNYKWAFLPVHTQARPQPSEDQTQKGWGNVTILSSWEVGVSRRVLQWILKLCFMPLPWCIMKWPLEEIALRFQPSPLLTINWHSGLGICFWLLMGWDRAIFHDMDNLCTLYIFSLRTKVAWKY